jgi:hypothetical protein
VKFDTIFLHLLAALLLWSKAGHAASLGVFLPSHLPPKEIERTLKADPALKSLDIVVFAKFKEFENLNQKTPFDYAILPSSYHHFYSTYKPILQFTAKGNLKFQYVLLSLNKPGTPDDIAKSTVGIVDELGRSQMKKYVQETLLKGTSPKAVKTVTKVEDLFPLLALNNADYILVKPDDLKFIKEKYESKPHEYTKGAAIPFPRIYAKKSQASSNSIDFKKLSKETLGLLNFDDVAPINEGN